MGILGKPKFTHYEEPGKSQLAQKKNPQRPQDDHILGLSDKHFKATVKKALQEVRANTLEINRNVGSSSKETEDTNRNQTVILN